MSAPYKENIHDEEDCYCEKTREQESGKARHACGCTLTSHPTGSPAKGCGVHNARVTNLLLAAQTDKGAELYCRRTSTKMHACMKNFDLSEACMQDMPEFKQKSFRTMISAVLPLNVVVRLMFEVVMLRLLQCVYGSQ